MAIFTAVASGNWNTGAVWGNAGSVEGVDYPGSSDVGLINSNSITVTVTESTTSAYEIRRGSLTFSDGITFTYGQNCILGVVTYGYQCTASFGAGVTIDQGIYSTTTGQASILFTGNMLNPVTVNGSGDWLQAGFSTGENRRRYNLQYFRFLLTGDVQITTGRGDTSPSTTEFVLDRGVFVGYSSLNLQQWSTTWDVSITNIHCLSDGTVTMGRRIDGVIGNNIYQNIFIEAVTNSTLTFDDVGLATGGKFENLYLKNVQVSQFGSTDKWDFDGLFLYVDSYNGTFLSCINATISAANLYAECSSDRVNPHVIDVKNGSMDRAYFNIDYDLGFADDGDLVSPRNGGVFTLTRGVSMKSSGLLALTTTPTGTFVLDHCTLNTTKTGIDCLAKFENHVETFTGSLVVKNSIHVGLTAGAEIVQRSGDTTFPVVVDSVNNCATSNTSEVIESGENMTATSELNNQFGVDPAFVDDSRDLTSYGGIDYVMTADGFDDVANWFSTASGASISGLLTYLDGGFAPTNTALQGAADDAGDIGALAVQAAPTPSEGFDLVKIDLVPLDMVQ